MYAFSEKSVSEHTRCLALLHIDTAFNSWPQVWNVIWSNRLTWAGLTYPCTYCSRQYFGKWSDRSAMSGHKTLSLPDPAGCLHGLALGIWTSFWRREGPAGMDMWNAPMAQSRQPLTYRLMESVGLGVQRLHGSSWQRGIAESGSSRLLTLMINIPGDLVWDLPYMQQVSYLEGGPLMWMLPLYLHVNKKSVDDDDDNDDKYFNIFVSYFT